MKKKLLSLTLSACMLLCACNGAQTGSEANPTDTVSAAADNNGTTAPDTTTSDNGDTTADSNSTTAKSDGDTATEALPQTNEAVETAETTETAVTTNERLPAASTASTGTLTENAAQYEGIDSTGDFNYGEALQKSLLFYELQRSGDLPSETRCNWRGDSATDDGSSVGLDLSGGLYDAGDNAKFNLPMAYTASMLAWSVYEDYDAYKQSGQLEYALDNIRWINDYLIKCHPEDDVYYYQVGDGGADHSWWGAAEALSMDRPCFKVDINNGGSTVVGEAAASLAACALIFKDTDAAYSQKCLTHAKQLYDFADRTKSDAGYTAANGFYTSNSGYNDELAWAGVWLYLATDDNAYLAKSEAYIKQTGEDYKWAQCWDDVKYGTFLLLARITKNSDYNALLEKNLDFWLNDITYTPKGLAWLDSWGALRYATTQAFLAAVYSQSDVCPTAKKQSYWDFAVAQTNYALGSTGFSYMIGYGDSYPQSPHHRTAHGSWSNNINDPATARHTLYGALVGGPNSSDGYTDVTTDYVCNEVACDYNAGFTGVLAKLYGTYHGKTLVNFGAVEVPDGDELYTEVCVNVSGNDFVEIKAFVYNKTAWPARITDNLKLCYFFDLSEVYTAGGTASDIVISTNYMQGGTASAVKVWNEEKHIYYVTIDFTGVEIRPGGQSEYKKEVQFRIRNAGGVWDNSNDPSYAGLEGSNGGALVKGYSMALYEGDALVYGTEPDGKTAGSGQSVTSNPTDNGNGAQQTAAQTTKPQQPVETAATASGGDIALKLEQTNISGNNNTISFTVSVTNTGSAALSLDGMTLDYFFTADGSQELCFWCDHAALTNGDSYQALTSDIKGEFSAASGTNADKKCRIKLGGGALAAGGTASVQVRITKSDWSDFTLGNDYSSGNAEHIAVYYNGGLVCGKAAG